MSKTTNYGLNKPAQTDFYDVDVQNENMDKIDAALTKKVDKVEGKGLSTNDYNATDKKKVDNLPDDTKTELNKKVDSQTFDNHKNDSNIHTTSAEKEKWNKGVQKVTGATAGNFPSFNAEGGIVDSKKKPSDFLGSAHGTATIIGEPGLHGIRYWNEKLEVLVDGAWKQASSGVGIEVNVTVPTGSVVTATDGENVVTGTAVNNALKMALPNYGTWEFSATLNGETSNTVTLTCDASKVYTVTLTYFSATIKVTAKSGSVVTIKKGSVTQTATSTGTATFTVKEAGTYSVYATYEDVNSNTVSVNATTSGSTYTASVSFITLTVSIKTGSTVVVTKGSYSYSKVSTGTAVFYLPETGTWSVTASLSGDTATGTIACSSYTAYSLTLNYFKIFGVSIDLSNSDPASAVTYTDDAVGMTAGSSAWDSEPIFKDTPHCVVGQCSVETLGNVFAPTSRQASCQYGVGVDGRVGMYCEEKDRSWCSSSGANDHRAITIECASDTKHPYAMNDKVYNTLIELCADICKRNGKSKLIWFDDKEKTLAYKPKSDEMIITVHRWFANKSCPGDWLYERLYDLASKVTERLGKSSTESGKPQINENMTTQKLYKVQTGAFTVKANATALQNKLKAKGFDTYIVQVGKYYKVQVGAYKVKTNAEAMLKKLKEAGCADAFITYTDSTEKESSSSEIKVGDKVKVLVAKTYTGKAFKLYYSKYDVIEIDGDRVVIGIGKTVTAAVHKDNLKKI